MIPFVQFLRPDGRVRNMEFEAAPKTSALAQQAIKRGVRFEIEELTTGEISMEAMLDDECLASELCANGPPVVEAVGRLVWNAYSRFQT